MCKHRLFYTLKQSNHQKMKQLITPLLVLCFVFTHAQQRQSVQVTNEVLQSIKEDVWIPFMEAYDQSDSKKLKSIHTDDIVRVTLDENRIQTGAAYLERFGGFVESVKQRGGKIGIAFAILSTAMDETGQVAYQTGYYRFSSQGKDDNELVARGYGKFSVGLRKEDNQWKIWLDTDEGVNLSHEDFDAQEILYVLKQ